MVRNNVLIGTFATAAIDIYSPERIAAGESVAVVNNSVLREPLSTSNNLEQVRIRLRDTAFTGDLPIILANNIFQGRDGSTDIAVEGPADTTIDADHNLYYNHGTPYTGVTTRTGTNDILNTDPLYTPDLDADGYRLLTIDPASPAIDAGAGTSTYEAVPTDDYTGTLRPQGTAWDLGAHEPVP